MHDHISIFEKFLADSKNLDEYINDKVNVIILLHLLLEEYYHFVTTLLYEKNIIIFMDVCTTLTNLKICNNDKHFKRASFEVLLIRERTIEKRKKMVERIRSLKSINITQVCLLS